ncbi:uncharacterized protein TNIN_27981 [Trichonephila inaurata madagascariensis]|uniref:Uncharacterized protein n=1 Tax=Trichonephila inaurata madagascariensis TaxID=2747483 RepID=A0A8X7C111_9ARAC|nr:uncharacterized protein TNIN_27981 [Trichonephila inaurata madagascariensis]
MNYYLKLLYVCITCGLLALELHFVDSAEIGDGSMNYEDFDRCYRTITCYLGDEAYMETRVCYEIMTPQNYIEAVDIVKTAAADANLTFEADNLDDQRTEYCAYTEDEKRALYEHITGRLVDKFTTICSTRSKRHLCSNFEEFLDCGFRAMEKYAADGKCKMPEGLNKR